MLGSILDRSDRTEIQKKKDKNHMTDVILEDKNVRVAGNLQVDDSLIVSILHGKFLDKALFISTHEIRLAYEKSGKTVGCLLASIDFDEKLVLNELGLAKGGVEVQSDLHVTQRLTVGGTQTTAPLDVGAMLLDLLSRVQKLEKH